MTGARGANPDGRAPLTGHIAVLARTSIMMHLTMLQDMRMRLG